MVYRRTLSKCLKGCSSRVVMSGFGFASLSPEGKTKTKGKKRESYKLSLQRNQGPFIWNRLADGKLVSSQVLGFF
jgi:hypothetical protein